MKRRRHKRKIISKSHKLIILNIFLVSFFMLGIGYSLLSTELGINGLIRLFDFFHPVQVEVVELSTPQNGEYYQLEEEVQFKVIVTNKRSYNMTNGELEIELSGDLYTIDELAGYESKEFETSFTVSEFEIISGFADIEAVLNIDKNGDEITATNTLRINNIEPPTAAPFDLSIEVTSTPADNDYELDEIISYTLKVKNNGNHTLVDVLYGSELSGDEGTEPTIAPGQTITYNVVYSIVEEDILAGSINLDIYAYTVDLGTTEIRKTGSLVINNIKAPTANPLELQITNISPPANGTKYQKGELISYSIMLYNRGNYTVTDIETISNISGEDWEWPESLAPGTSHQYNTDFYVTPYDCTAGNIIIDAQTTAKSKVGNKSTQTSITLTNLEPLEPIEIGSVAVNAPAGTGTYGLGSTINYEVTVTNNTPQIAYNVALSSERGGSYDQWTIAQLLPGESRTFPCSYEVTESDILAGEALNYVTVTGQLEDGTVINDVLNSYVFAIDPPETNINPPIAIENEQTTYHLGETVTFDLSVINDGNITLTDIDVTCFLTGDSWRINSLSPAQQTAYQMSFMIDSNMVAAGQACIDITITAKTPEDNYTTTRTFTNTYCVNVS